MGIVYSALYFVYNLPDLVFQFEVLIVIKSTIVKVEYKNLKN